MKRLCAVLLLLSLTTALGCGGGTSGGITVTVKPSQVTLTPGEEHAFTATVTNAADTAVTWKVQEANGGTITSAGVYTAPLLTGTYHVIATSSADPSKSGQATIQVIASGGSGNPMLDVKSWRGTITVTCQNGHTTGSDSYGTTYDYRVDTAGTIEFTMYGPYPEVNNRYSWSLKRDEPVVASNCHYRETTKITLGAAYNIETTVCPPQTVTYSWPSWPDLDIRIIADLNSNTYRLSFSPTPLKGDMYLKDEAGEVVDESHRDDEGYLPGAQVESIAIPGNINELSGSDQVKVPFGRGGELTLNVSWRLVKKVL